MIRRRARRLRALPWKRIVLIGVPSSLLVLLALVGVAYARTDVPPPKDTATAQAVVLRYAGGEEMARLGTNRVIVPLSEISAAAQKAVLAAEDRGFYTEPGISPRGIARALFTNVRGGGSVQQGGSTITQQYAKNAILTTDRTYSRKVREVFIALKMTRERSKEQILADYLNTIYFGRGASGIEAASRAYFGPRTQAKDLTVAQAAVLASSIRSPAGYEPIRHPERARERFAYVLDGMVSSGWLSPQERAAVRYPEVVPQRRGGADLSGPLGHVVAAVRDELEARGFADEDGLVVTTTVRRSAQRAAADAVQEVTGDDTDGKGLQGALVAVEPGTGAVVAYYGGANGAGIDYAGRAPRQPGSSFKPYVLAAALDEGISLSRRYDGNSPKLFPGGVEIENFGGVDEGRVDLVTATRDSVNTAYFELGLEVGPQDVAETAHEAGIPERVRLANPTTGAVEGGIALGQYPVRVLDQAVGFATFASGGVAAAPYLVQQVERDGERVYRAKADTSRAFGEDVAADATYAMQQVVRSGSGTRAQLQGGRPAAGKTGTSSDNKDLWFAGYTPQLSAAVWFGYGRPERVRIDGVTQATGGRISAGVWKEFVDEVLDGEPVEDFPPRAFVGGAPPAPPVLGAVPPRTGAGGPGRSGSGSGGGSGGGGSSAGPVTRSPEPRPTATRSTAAPRPTSSPTRTSTPTATRSATPRPSATRTPARTAEVRSRSAEPRRSAGGAATPQGRALGRGDRTATPGGGQGVPSR